MNTCIFIIVIINVGSCFGSGRMDYYWKEYTGVIPEDAIEGGLDVNKKPTYIGQASFPGYHHLQVVEIHRGITEVWGSHDGRIYSTTSNTKILCSTSKQAFKWLKVNGKKLHMDIIGKRAVIGGEESDGLVNIGRVNYRGESLIVGKVLSKLIDNSILQYIHKTSSSTTLLDTYSFEILIYNGSL